MDRVLMVVAYDISKTSTNEQTTINALQKQAEAEGIAFYGVTAGLYDDVENFRHANNNAFDYMSCDAITLKTIIRSNPGLVMLKKGTVVGKWHNNDLPNFESIKAL